MRNSNRPAMTLGAIVIALSLGVTAVDAAEGKLDTELLRKAFDEADMNGDGRLGEGEFAADGVTAFVSVDKNGDGKLSRAELGAAGADSFGKLDANGDGSLTIIEVMKVKTAEFERADANHDGKLTFEEVADFERRR